MSDEAIGKRLLRRTAERPLIRVILSCATYRWPSAERALSAFFFLPTDYCFNSKGLGNARYADEKGKKTCVFICEPSYLIVLEHFAHGRV